MIGTAYGGGSFWTKNPGLFTLALLAGFFLTLWLALDITEGRLRVSEPGVELEFQRGEREIAPGRVIPIPGLSSSLGEGTRKGEIHSLALFGWVDGNPGISSTLFRFRLTYDGVPGAKEYKVDGNFWNSRRSRIGDRPVRIGWFDLLTMERDCRELGIVISNVAPESPETGRIWLGRAAWTRDGGTPQWVRAFRRIAAEGTLFFGGCWLAAAAVASLSFRNGEFGRLALLVPAALIGWRLMFHRGTLEPLVLGSYSVMSWDLDGVPRAATESESPLFPWLIRLSEIRWDSDFTIAATVLSLLVFFTVGWTILRETRLRPGWAEVVALVGILGSPLFFGLPGCSGLLKKPGFADGTAIFFASLALWHGRSGVRFPAAFLAMLGHGPLTVGMLLTGGLARVASSDDRGRATWRLLSLLPALAAGQLFFWGWYHAVGFAGAEGQRLAFAQGWGLWGMVQHIAEHKALFFGGLHAWLWPFVLLLGAALWRVNRPVFWALLAGQGIALGLQFLATDWHRVFEAVQWPGLVIAAGVAFRQAGRGWRVALWASLAFSAAGMLVAVGVLRLQ
ncbi:hypothetical protein SAMN05444156_0166 [Verrucomicrobium sp. GAS474]|uniref:hypothetical protein n=1 Tax=Verrucomicrobium sp. GAS474 TaxID=1882831 RepID=UPI00087A297B|nr:hypothetical protein [Verrucomicrobium sp. GAS474]SDT86288.1 hypothetical protein SAMN05444156_0166 [Verrucomicrobium sp. GAS474]